MCFFADLLQGMEEGYGFLGFICPFEYFTVGYSTQEPDQACWRCILFLLYPFLFGLRYLFLKCLILLKGLKLDILFLIHKCQGEHSNFKNFLMIRL